MGILSKIKSGSRLYIHSFSSAYVHKGVHLEEQNSPISRHWNGDIDDFVRNLTHPKGTVDRAQTVDVATLDRLEKMKLQSPITTVSEETLSVTKTTKQISDTIKEQKSCDNHSNPRKSWKRHILMRKNAKTLPSTNSKERKESVEFSCGSQEDEGVGLKDVSFDSSSSGPRVSFQCESSESSDHECSSSIETTVSSVSTSTQRQYQKREKDGKESKRRRFRRIITKPLRRSHSAGCEKDLPSHAMFVHPQTSSGEDKPEKDTMESRAADLSLYQRQLFGEEDSGSRRMVHKTCSADAAMMASEEYGGIGANNNTQTKSKSRNLAKNMKRKFQFLRRRNTDSALGGSMVTVHQRPSIERAGSWSQSFENLLSDKCGIDLFHGFLRSEFSEENLDFWVACQDFKNIKDDSQLSVQAQKIYSEYVAFQAPNEVNLDSKTRMQTISGLESPTQQTFDLAQKKIQALMEKDSYQRFLESDIYQQLVRPEPKSPKSLGTSPTTSKC